MIAPRGRSAPATIAPAAARLKIELASPFKEVNIRARRRQRPLLLCLNGGDALHGPPGRGRRALRDARARVKRATVLAAAAALLAASCSRLDRGGKRQARPAALPVPIATLLADALGARGNATPA